MNGKIGFIGLGQMGRWMAINLLKNDFNIVVFDTDQAAVRFVTDRGAQQAGSLADLSGDTQLLFFSLPNYRVIEKVVCGNQGLLTGNIQNPTWIDLGTSSYVWARQFSEKLGKRGISFADAPVSGMEQRAKDGTLTVMFGGEKRIFDEIAPALASIGSEIVHMGGAGSGQLAKMINNVLLNVNIAALSELLPMAVKLGLEPENITRVINSGSGQSFASRTFLPKILESDFTHGYALSDAYKDMANICEVSSQEKIPLPVVYSALSTYQSALAMGYGEEDKGAMMKVFETFLHVRFRSEQKHRKG
jgi:3-hydroxyisobutyrate dehydrogenase-like beta-hydroxyacid dehydrogenase